MASPNFMVQLRADITDFASKMAQASSTMARFAATAASSASRNNAAFTSYGQSIKSSTQELFGFKTGLKDVSRIVQGIIISQTFYKIAGAITEATAALWSFNESLDYARVSFSALFGSQDLGNSFLAGLQQQAEDTIFTFEQLTSAARKLLAYGIPKENLLYITEGLTNLGALSGDAAALDRIAFALGQIYAKGKLSAEEMRQLANAYIPIAQIIQDTFGLTEEQMGRVGDLNLPAEQVINAIVDYANTNFGAVGDAAMYTITGLKNKIVDSFKNLGVEILEPVTMAYKSLLVYIAEALQSIKEAYAESGLHGIFEHLVPDPNTQRLIRQVLANVVNLWNSFLQFMYSVRQILSSVMMSLAGAFNVLTPIVNTVINVLIGLMQTITGNATLLRYLTGALVTCAAAWVIFKVKALSAMVVVGLAKVIYALAAAVLTLSRAIMSNPIVAALLALTVGLVSFSAASDDASNSVSDFFDNLSDFNGVSSDDIFPEGAGGIDDAIPDINDFGDAMGDAEDAAGGVGDAIEEAGNKAKKAAAGLLSFDEVFKLNDQKETDLSPGGGGGGGGLGAGMSAALESLEGLGAALSDALIPDIPDLSDFATNFVSSLKDSLIAKLGLAGFGLWLASKLGALLTDAAFTKGMSAAALAIATTFVKLLKGAFIGLAFDALASLITEKLWTTLENALNLDDGSAHTAKIGATIGSIIGGAIGSLVGGLPGSIIGAAIGHLAGGIVGLLAQEIEYAFSNTAIGGIGGILAAFAKAWSTTIDDFLRMLPSLLSAGSFSGFFKNLGALFTSAGLKSLAKGGLIGAAIGFVTDAIAALLWKTLADAFELGDAAEANAKIGQTIGSIIGTIIGGLIGGPAGALIGTAIGTFAGGLGGLFFEKIVAALQPITSWIVEALVSAFISLQEWWTQTSAGFSTWWSATSTGFSTWWNDTWSGLSTWWSDTTTGFSTWWNDTWSGLRTWWNDTVALFSDWDGITGDTLSTWWTNTTTGFSTWWTNTWTSLSTWWSNTTSGFTTWWTETGTGFMSWYEETTTLIVGWVEDLVQRFNEWKEQTLKPIIDWINETIQKIAEWASETIQKIAEWASETIQKIKTWITDTIKAIADWVINIVKSFMKFKADVLKVIIGFTIAAVKAFQQWCQDVWSEIKQLFTDLVKDIKDWWKNCWDISRWTAGWTLIKGWFSGLLGSIGEWFSGAASSIRSWWDGLWSGLSAPDISLPSITSSSSTTNGYATGGIVNRDQIARIAEGNKAEAIIPLENATAMRPFANAVSQGVLESLAPTLLQSSSGGSSAGSLPPMYVGTLIADERGLKQLYKKFEIIQLQENARRGLANG